MAESKDKVYTIPLRHEWLRVARDKRNKKAVRTIKEYLSHHLHSLPGNIRISSMLSSQINSRGIQKPPSKVKVKVRVEEGIVHAMVPGESVLKEPLKKGKKAKAAKTGEQLKARQEESKNGEGKAAAGKKEDETAKEDTKAESKADAQEKAKETGTAKAGKIENSLEKQEKTAKETGEALNA